MFHTLRNPATWTHTWLSAYDLPLSILNRQWNFLLKIKPASQNSSPEWLYFNSSKNWRCFSTIKYSPSKLKLQRNYFWNSLNLFIKYVSSNIITRQATRIGLNTQQLTSSSVTPVYWRTINNTTRPQSSESKAVKSLSQ